ncbi:hypothetical protein L6164_005150 [Bauhinia variegata]|uniref:Uncharacterized protein n=1 Tax=Bauhinia variegata TaxID=167791 RepID=A0ACB9PQD2_BAUVA|nr:hypothetical protein L6164_005150 [Bauhinia variegata]
MREKDCHEERGSSDNAGKVVVVAVKAAREISRNALVWALTHVAQPGDCIKLLVIIPAISSSKRIWGLSRFTSDCTTSNWRSPSGTVSDQKEYIANSCYRMVRQLHEIYDLEKIKVRIKILSGFICGVVAAEAKRVQSSWVILDKKLKQEKKCCIEELHCNIVVMNRSRPNVLRLNLMSSIKMEHEGGSWSTESNASPRNFKGESEEHPSIIRGPAVTPSGSPEQGSPLTVTDGGTLSMSSSDPGASPFFHSDIYGRGRKEFPFVHNELNNLEESESLSESESEKLNLSSKQLYFQPWIEDFISTDSEFSKQNESMQTTGDRALISTCEILLQKFSRLDQEPGIGGVSCKIDVNLSKSVREAISLARNAPLGPPPLCSICQHKTPAFGNPPKWFTYAELELATGGFSQANFLAEGGYGSVHRGVLLDGLVVAVKQYKLASSQGDKEFCSEVEVLNCAQHRNVVMLMGFCVEGGRRLLVYEYICNKSLDFHLYGRKQVILEWPARQKIAVGAARGLRYLHEECRVGCIVHRDMRPNNILLTHDFEVGDFGLARWQPDGDMAVETRVIGTFGYLAPEYAESGQITEKADVYSFGVVLLGLVTGRKAVDVKRPKGQQCLTEWARPLLERQAIHELVDPIISNCYNDREVHRMLQCSSLCIRWDPHLRPRMSQVLRMLEDGDGDRQKKAGTGRKKCSDKNLAHERTMSSLLKLRHHGPFSSALRSCFFERRFFNYVAEGKLIESSKSTNSSFIHPSAIVHPNTFIGQGVSIGPFCSVSSSAKIGNGCRLYPGSHIFGRTVLGDNCILMTGAIIGDGLPGCTIIGSNNTIGYHAVVGVKCQDMKSKPGDESFLEVGDNNDIREHVSVHRSSNSTDRTVIGDNNLIMGSCHIAHDCKVGNNNIFANSTLLAGHVKVEDYVHTAGATVVHQFCHLGSFSFLGGGSVVSQDVPTYMMVAGERAEIRGLNVVGLRRHGFSVAKIRSLKAAYRKIFMPVDANAGAFEERLAEVEQHEELVHIPAVRALLQSIRNSFAEDRRGICKFRHWNGS